MVIFAGKINELQCFIKLNKKEIEQAIKPHEAVPGQTSFFENKAGGAV